MKNEHISLNLNTAETIDDVKSAQPEDIEDDPLAVGRERMESIGEFFVSAREKVGGAVDNVKGSISRFWSKAKSFGKDTVAVALSADELAIQAVRYGREKTDEAIEWAEDRVTDAGDWVGEKGEQVGSFVSSSYETAKDFASNKVEQVQQFGKDKIDLVKDVGFFLEEKTGEGLDKAKDALVSRYNKIKAFGEGALSSAKMEAAGLKQAFRGSMNNLRLRRLEAELRDVLERESETSAEAERIRKQKEDLAQKMTLLQDLALAA